MQYLIDGHNLIPYIPGLSLGDLDDESALIHLLQIHARMTRSKVEVFFDQAPAGHSGNRKEGTITVHSVAKPSIADRAIIERLKGMKKTASTWVVVSSDNQVKSESRRLGARTMESGGFSKEIQRSLKANQKKTKTETQLSSQEVDDWLKLFEGRNNPRGPGD
jgi:uncharacterized protein